MDFFYLGCIEGITVANHLHMEVGELLCRGQLRG